MTSQAYAGMLWSAFSTDQACISELRSQRADLLIGKDVGFTLTSATAAGQSFAGQTELSKLDRLAGISQFLAWVDQGGRTSTRTIQQYL